MVVKMVLGKVCKLPHIVLYAVYPLLIQRMGGNLHYHHVHLLVLHLAEYALEVNALGCGALGVDDYVANHVAYGTYQANLFAHALGNGFEHVCGAGLAICTGNAYHLHFP